MARTTAKIPEGVHRWIDLALDQASLDVFYNDEKLVCYASRYEHGGELQTFITYATEQGIFGARNYLVFAVFDVAPDGEANAIQMTDELRITGRETGIQLAMAVSAKVAAMTRAVADVGRYGVGLPFKRTQRVARTA